MTRALHGVSIRSRSRRSSANWGLSQVRRCARRMNVCNTRRKQFPHFVRAIYLPVSHFAWWVGSLNGKNCNWPGGTRSVERHTWLSSPVRQVLGNHALPKSFLTGLHGRASRSHTLDPTKQKDACRLHL